MRAYYYFDPKGKSEDATNGNFDILDDKALDWAYENERL